MNKNTTAINMTDFTTWIKTLKSKIHTARNKLVFSINSQILELYWEIGRDIVEKQQNSNWGSSFVEKIAEELKHEFPEIKGFSRRNVYAILQWYKFYSAKYQFVPHAVAQIPWGHNRLIVSKIKDVETAEFYVIETAKNAWDRDTLEIQIENNYHLKIGNLTHNFAETLPAQQSQFVVQILKDPYNFDFLGLENDALEKAIEDELAKNITKFLLELGKGFAFLGRQYKIEIGDTDHFLDMLFYHVDLRCYIVIELKSGKFQPEYAGKLNYYLSAVDSQLRKVGDNSTIGILLCKKKNKIDVEYALRDIHKPMGISEYRLTDAIPEDIKSQLPSVEDIERELENVNIRTKIK
ncbi:MAG: PDDEXK nuclease domain-containing protein [Dysgonamonadaceae bacterium]|jgi:predicted nuclease of restriction endonuclease-like (RecB) superfamily|nr:PDDEXK nuclease domain-containing protein [Dysgonamonadaceae bacterium]